MCGNDSISPERINKDRVFFRLQLWKVLSNLVVKTCAMRFVRYVSDIELWLREKEAIYLYLCIMRWGNDLGWEIKGISFVLFTEKVQSWFLPFLSASVWMGRKYRHSHWKMLTKMHKTSVEWKTGCHNSQVWVPCHAWHGLAAQEIGALRAEKEMVLTYQLPPHSPPGPVSTASFSAGNGHDPSACPWPSVPSPPLSSAAS